MKQILLFLIICFSFNNLYSQLDREHWFAPMVDRVSSTHKNYQSIYLSTGETTPFKVDIYFDNAIVESLVISKNNPQRYIIPSSERERIIINPGWDHPEVGLFQPVSMGFYLKGEKPFFASLRFSITNHGEIQTSKGTAALGTEFRAVMAPLSAVSGSNNFMNSIMATENNTTVTVSVFQPDVIFTDEIPRTQITFTLNKGQSYIIEGTDSFYENWSGYIGAKIVSDKPVVVANGNFNGQYATTSSSSDILMDQGVPVNKLGKNFVLVKGNGANSYDSFGNKVTMEKAMIVAVRNNTKIYLNGNATPAATLNAGEYFATPPDSYVDQGSGHFNMYIEATEDIYVYQLLAGKGDNLTDATGGFNYIPPLSCYLPKKIDEIGAINENEYTSNNVPYSLTVPTKLNIITEKGATIDVKRNGTSLAITPANGPYNVSGNSNWVTYSLRDISGNIAITSTHAVTAGITAGNDAVGYGGFFAGFSSIPMIVKIEGECLPDDVKLAVIEGYDHYQWLLKDINGNYIPAPVTPRHPSNTDYFYYPSQAGIYAVQIQTGSCASVQTEDYKFFNCTTYTNIDYDICSTIVITPSLFLSTQILNPSTVKIDTPPTKGTIRTNPNGTIVYTANPDATGIDTFKYSFCGIGAIPDCETIQATLHIKQTVKYNAVLTACSTNGLAPYNLNLADVTQNINVTKTYYKDAALTQQIPENQISNYISADGFVYVKLINTSGCPTTSAAIELKSTPHFVVPSEINKTVCDDNLDGIKTVELSDYIPDFTADTGVAVSYFLNATDADNNANAISGTVTVNNSAAFYLRFSKSGFCDTVAKLNIIIKIPKTSETLVNKETCPETLTTLDAGSGFDFYEWSTGETTQTIDVPIGDYWVDLYFEGCVYRQEVKVTEAGLPQITHVEVSGSTATIYAIGGKPPYQYSLDNIHFQLSNVFTNIPKGLHIAYVKDFYNCAVVQMDFLIINLINVITPNDDGINDVSDYSVLKMKKDVKIEIYDRYGKLVFTSEKGNFIWNGTLNGRKVATGSYWYSLSWVEPFTNSPVSYKGWILVKNRD